MHGLKMKYRAIARVYAVLTFAFVSALGCEQLVSVSIDKSSAQHSSSVNIATVITRCSPVAVPAGTVEGEGLVVL